ncbi:MAG TPA: hypothetical protein VE263_02905 [Candidatus Angelobacter sp.]|nr:hypothetical protein [Candidatus Angelobacter sp.]
MMQQDDLIANLARRIDAAKKAEYVATDGEQVAALRRRGACELHSICAEFVSSVNGRLSQAALDLSPSGYTPEMFRESGANLIRIGSQGREMQITFGATAQLFSAEKFPIRYVLEGEVRTFNQSMLERFEIRSQTLFFCLEEDNARWHSFDWRTRRTGPVGTELLVGLMGRLF